MKITPHGEEDISLNDNRSTFTIGYADLAIKEVKEVRTDNGRRLVITIINQGYASANGTFKVIDGNVNQTVFSNNSISQLQPGSTVEVTYEIDETRLNSSVSEDPLMFKLEIASDEEEPNYVNNNHTTYVYPDYSINLISGVGGTVSGDGVYMYNSIATLTATPNPGYIFAGWYENGQLLDNLAAEYSFDVL